LGNNAIGPIIFGLKMKEILIFDIKGISENKNAKKHGALDLSSLIELADHTLQRCAPTVCLGQLKPRMHLKRS
jgi:hypothetical protein